MRIIEFTGSLLRSGCVYVFRHRYRFCSNRHTFTPGDFVESFDCRRMIIPVAARTADAYWHIFKHDKAIFVLENFFFYHMLFNRALTIFATITIHFLILLIFDCVNRYDQDCIWYLLNYMSRQSYPPFFFFYYMYLLVLYYETIYR